MDCTLYFQRFFAIASLAFVFIVPQTQLVKGVALDGSQNVVGPRIVILPSEPVFFIDTQNPSNKALTCQTAGDKPGMFSQLRWTGPNRLDNWDELSKRHSVLEEEKNSNIWDLEFRNPTVDDAGVYYCHGTYQSSDVYNASIVVKVNNPIKLENCPERQFLVQGSTNNKITCRISADLPRVTLMKDGNHLDQYDNRYKWDNDDGLVINGEVNKSDAGRYLIKVKAQLTGERKQQYIDVEVHSGPEIAPFNGTENQSEFYGVEGDQAQLECKVSGNPQPLVYWLDPRLRNVTSIGGYIVNPERGTLKINRVNRVDDNGQFQCFAYNTVGTASRKVSMTVDIRPQIVAFENKTVDEGADVTFECRSTGDPAPAFSIRKQGINQLPYKNGDGIYRDSSTVQEGGGSNIHVHRLTVSANRSMFGFHYCNVTNRAGSVERIGQLTVNHKPDLSQTPREQYVKLGKRITVTCHIRAYPEPKVSWYVDTTQIINVESSIKTSTDGQTHIVTMMPPNPQQTAFSRFVCVAENKMGISEQAIVPRYTTAPGVVAVTLQERSPTTVKLQLTVPNDGGDRIKFYKYKLEGRTMDIHNPTYNFREDRQNETIIDASLSPTSLYTIRNLLPHYMYRISIRAVNDVGEGDAQDIHVETTKPTRPDPPIIIKPGAAPSQQSGFNSDYQNGYVLKWGAPDLDNGDTVTKYIIKYGRLDTDSLDITTDSQQRVVEQMNERPMHARLGPLDVNQRYRIQIQARNNYGDSEPATIIIQTSADRPMMPDFELQTLAWLTEPSTPTLIALLVLAVVLLIVIDMIFCFCFQIGVTHLLRIWCCPAKTNSVISDKTYT